MANLFRVLSFCFFVTIYLVAAFFSVGQAQVTLTVEDGLGAAGSDDNPIDVILNNPSEKVKSLQLDVCDVGDLLAIASCETTIRSSSFSCIATEEEDGCVSVTLFVIGGDVIEEGNGPIFTLNYNVSPSAPLGECRELYLENAQIANENNLPLDSSSAPGEFCFIVDTDTDEDTILDQQDNCPNNYNPLQEDADDSGIGDICNDAQDLDGDEWENAFDNCLETPNGPYLGTCVRIVGSLFLGMGVTCTGNEECAGDEICDLAQLDFDDTGVGDACECRGNFDFDEDIDGSDAFIFKTGFGRSRLFNPCPINQ